MKKFSLILFFVFILFSYNSFAVCCESGCFREYNICCEDPSIGYTGCEDFSSGTVQYVCPDSGLGECLRCFCPSPDNCYWVEDLSAFMCNACEIESDQGFVIDSSCSPDCPEGTNKCEDFTCQENCGDLEGDCTNDGVCNSPPEGCHCLDCQNDPTNVCVSGLTCCSNVCSGNIDGDPFCDYDDYCIQIPSTEDPQPDEDEDCYFEGERSLLFGYCGDDCDETTSCYDAYGAKQCCDDLGAIFGVEITPEKPFYGFTEDCSKVNENSIGCWGQCLGEGGTVTFDVGQCVDGLRIITKYLNGSPVESVEDSCTSIPLIPFFTSFNILITFLILVGYYVRRSGPEGI